MHQIAFTPVSGDMILGVVMQSKCFFWRITGGQSAPTWIFHSKRPQPEGHAQVLQVGQSRDYKARETGLRLKLARLKESPTDYREHYNQMTYLPTLSRTRHHTHPSWLRTLWCRPQPNRGGSPGGKRNHTPKRGLRAGRALRSQCCWTCRSPAELIPRRADNDTIEGHLGLHLPSSNAL
jgi:hypothetical protein